MKRGKNAVAPVITTILLVLIVLVLASIIIVWGLSFIPEKVAKFGGPIENACADVGFTAEYSGSQISVVNTGNVPIYRFRIKQDSQARSDIDTGDVIKLNPGSAEVLSSTIAAGTSEITLIPVLLGQTDSGKIQEFSCPSSSWQIIET